MLHDHKIENINYMTKLMQLVRKSYPNTNIVMIERLYV
jgi:hypothetical protein